MSDLMKHAKHTILTPGQYTEPRGLVRVARRLLAAVLRVAELIFIAERHGGVLPEEHKHWEY